MITKEQFTELINTILAFNKELDRWHEFGIDLFDLPIGDISTRMSELTYTNLFDDKGIDWINWWLYDRPALFEDYEPNKAYNEDGSEIPTETIDDLWNLVEKFRK